MANPFADYPLSTNVDDNDSSKSGFHSGLHNSERRAANELQDTLTALAATVATQASQISALQTAQALFNAAWTTYTPTLFNVTVGTGSTYGAYFKNGRFLTFRAGFKLGSGFTMTSSPVGLTIPFAAQVAVDRPALVSCYAQNVSVSWPTGGVGAIFSTAPDRVTRVAGLGFLDFSPGPWNRDNPQFWSSGDTLSVEGTVELASV